MSILSSLLWMGWRAGDRLGRALRRTMFAGLAELGDDVTFLATSNVLNAQRRREAIRIGAHTIVGGELFAFAHGGRIEIGEWCFVGPGSRIWSAEAVTIGNRVLVSHGVNIHDCNSHPRDPRERHAHFRAIATTGHPPGITSIESRPVVIGDDAWIGFNATILKGVTIGAGSIVAACSLVTRDVPPNSLHVGSAVVGPAA